MSALQKLKQTKQPAAAGSRPVAETVCVTVTGYENVDATSEQERFVVGTRNDTGEEVRVFLRPQESVGKFARSGVQEFASFEARKPAKAAVHIGGEIRFDGVFPDRNNPGVLSANWGVVTSHQPGESVSAKTFVRVNKVNVRDGGKASCAIDVLRMDKAVLAADADQLKARLVAALTPVNAGNAAFAVLRAITPEGVAKFDMVYAKRDESVADKWVAMSPEKSAEAFLATPAGKLYSEVAQSAEASIEVIRGTRMFVGAMTVGTMVEKGTHQNFDKRWRFAEEAKGNGFVESWLTMRQLADKFGNPVEPATMIVTSVAAATSASQVYGLENAPTENLKAIAAPAVPQDDGLGDPDQWGLSDDMEDIRAAMAAYSNDSPSRSSGPGI